MHVHTRRNATKRWALVAVSHEGRRTIVDRFWTKEGAIRYLRRTWPNHDTRRVKIERIA